MHFNMTAIHQITEIKAPINLVFDLSRNIDLHKLSTSKSNETVIAGVDSGLINLNETVTWRGKHFGIYLTHKSSISQMEVPSFFEDVMLEGRFTSFKHQHFFSEQIGVTTIKDVIEYQVPFGIFGKFFDAMVLKKYLTKFIGERNEFIKNTAENN